MANYEAPASLLKPYLPPYTELSDYHGKHFVSLVGFMFLKTRLLGLSIPFHRNFEEVNLRFYVRRKMNGEWREGLVFIREIVPKPAITLVANTVYKEQYATRQMRHSWDISPDTQRIAYEWKSFAEKDWYRLAVEASSVAEPMAPGSPEEYIAEHYWGYARRNSESSNEYEVRHPRWDVYRVRAHEIRGDFRRLYGPAFGDLMTAAPATVFLAEGSEVSVETLQVLR